MEDSDDIRGLIERRLLELGLDHAVVSRQIGKGRTYLHDYFVKRSPKSMAIEQKLLLAPILGLSPAQLGVGPSQPFRQVGGFADDDIEDYVAGPDSPIPPQHIVLKRIVNRALDQHPRGLVPGKVIPFNTRLIDPATIEPGSVVWVQLAKRSDPLVHAGSIIRQFLPPNKLVTNSSETNDIMSLDDVGRDLVASIMGTMVSYLIDDQVFQGYREETVALTKPDLKKMNREGSQRLR